MKETFGMSSKQLAIHWMQKAFEGFEYVLKLEAELSKEVNYARRYELSSELVNANSRATGHALEAVRFFSRA